jgi:N-dimethylarginine dimethylaminohydrolase
MPEPDDRAWVDGHIYQYSLEELKEMLAECGFEISKVDYSQLNSTLTNINIEAIRR